MNAYLIANVDVHDPIAYEAYRSQTQAIVESHGGRFRVRGGAIDILEGDPRAHRLVIIEFPDMAAARGFYDSAAYQAIIPLRTGSADAALFIVEGVGDD